VTVVWELYRTDDVGGLRLAGSFETLAAVAERIVEVEATPVRSLLFKVQVELAHRSDDEALNNLEYQGRHCSYLIKRVDGVSEAKT
jgi:hypothetical protein